LYDLEIKINISVSLAYTAIVFKRRKVYSKKVDYICSADLIEVNNDNGYNDAFTVIDLRIRYALLFL